MKEALEGIAPGGGFRLIHLRGIDLVADGLAKPLLGQSFMSLLRDLGMRPQQGEEGDGGGYGTAPHVAAVLCWRWEVCCCPEWTLKRLEMKLSLAPFGRVVPH